MYRLTQRAESDILAIGRYTQDKWGVDQRRQYLSQLDTVLRTLAKNRGLGVKRDEIRNGARSHVIASHVIWYRIVHKDIEILRILHHAMDPENHL